MPGIFSLSIDVELAWGLVHRSKIDLTKVKNISINVREVMDDLFTLFENYEIPITWNILGHLILDRCSKDNPKTPPHSDMPRPNYSWLDRDWYRYDPCTDVSKDPAWYGEDIVDKIVQYITASNVPHEIGCHSFSHQQFGDPGCGEKLARAEIIKCLELMKARYNVVPKSFAFPRDYVGHLHVLKECGFAVFRDVPPKLYPCLKLEKTISNYVKTYSSVFIQFLSYYLLFPPHVATLKEGLPGIWTVPGCLPFSRKPLIPLWLVTHKAKQGINKAILERKIFSVHTHLMDFGANGHFLSEFEKMLSYVAMKREKGELEVKTMTQLVKELT